MGIATLSPDEASSELESNLGMGIVSSVLGTLGLPGIVVDRLVDVASTAKAHAEGGLDHQSDDVLLDALSVSYAMQGQLEADSVEITRVLTRRAAERLLGERGFTSPEELGARARKTWRRDTKFAVAAELQALLGLGIQESYDMIALANAPAAVREPVTKGMTDRGARWGEARKFWDEAGDLDHEDAADVAEALFGGDPDRVVRERLERDDEAGRPEADDGSDAEGQGQDGGPAEDDTQHDPADAQDETSGEDKPDPQPDGEGAADGEGGANPQPDDDSKDDRDAQPDADSDADDEGDAQGEAGDQTGSQGRSRVKDCPWPTKTFLRELKREVAARRKEADQHRRARRRCGMSVSIGSDGLSTLTFTGETLQIVGMSQRVEDAARRARREGAESNLDTLRFRSGAILLMHASLPELGINPALGADDGTLLDPDQLLSPTDLERIAAILTAQPAVELQIITPLDAIIGADALDFLRGRCSCAYREPSSGPSTTTDPASTPSAASDPTTTDPSSTGPASDEAAGPKGSGKQPVGEVLGTQPAFLSAEHLRELLCRPRSVLRRLVTDPVTGFLVHRESRGYRPDAALRAFVRARDVMCKGIGCTHPAFYADLDHVINYRDGPTSAANLNLDCRREHLVKTYGLTKCAMDETGVVHWTTFFGRIYMSEPHDYLQYSPTMSATPAQTDDHDPAQAESRVGSESGASDAAGSGDETDVRDLILSGRFLRGMQRDEAERLAGRLIYAALAHRPPRSRLRASDDGPWDETVPEDPHAWLSTAPIRLWHTTPGGQRRHGPPPDQPTPEEILVEEGLAERVDPSHPSGEDRDPWQDLPPF